MHHESVPHRYAFSNITKIDTVYNAKNRSWQGSHYAITTDKNRELFETDFIVQGDDYNVDSTRIRMQVNKHCMTELLLLDSTKILCLFDTGSKVNIISESVINSSEQPTYIGLHGLRDPEYKQRNKRKQVY